MDERINSDSTMLATASFNHILHQIQTSCLNYQLRITPFSASIQIKKSLVKNMDGQPFFSVNSNSYDVHDLPSDNTEKNFQLSQELDLLKSKQKEYVLELAAVYKTIDDLKNEINARDVLIKELAHNDIKIQAAHHNPMEPHAEVFVSQYDVVDDENVKFLSPDFVQQEIDQDTLLYCDGSGSVKSDIIEIGDDHSCVDASSTQSCVSAANVSSSLASHWIPSSNCDYNSDYRSLSSFISLRSHYVRLPDPGKSFSSLEHLDQEFRELLRAQRAGRQDCRQS